MKFISIRIASKGYTIYNMSPLTATQIVHAMDNNDDSEKNSASISVMAHSIASAIVGSRSIFYRVRIFFLQRRLMRKASLDELFKAYHRVLLMLPLEDIAAVSNVMKQLSETISKDHE